ncbi:hypothetical protein AO265_39855 [Pseudomonas sp. ABAC61]|nr:hypothetical protein AO265_39855 [Pseudomonas sp. ABAC61]
MSNKLIGVPRELLQETVDGGYWKDEVLEQLRTLLAQPALAVKQYGQDSVTGHSDVEVTLSSVTHYDHGPNVAEALARLACRVARFYKLEAPTLAAPSEQHQGDTPNDDKSHPRFIAGYKAGMHDQKLSQHQGEPVAWRVQRITPTGNHRLDRPLLTLATPEEWGPAWKAESLYTRPGAQPEQVAFPGYPPVPGDRELPAPVAAVTPVDSERERLMEIVEQYPNVDPLEYDAAVRTLRK